MNYYKLKITPDLAGADVTKLLKAENEEEANQMAQDEAVSHYESYGIEKESYEEENGIELEYDYVLTKITEEEYKEMIEENYEEIN